MLVFVGVLVAASTPALATEQMVWRIGAFDGSSAEFRIEGIDYSDPKQDPVYRVGESKDSEDWQRFQPGPANGLAGGREHPFTILFTIADEPRGVYHLRIAMLYETPRLSFLRVSLNGHAGFFYFHPQLDYRAGDWEGTFVPQTSADEKAVELPGKWFIRGENRLVLTALDDPSTPEKSLGAIATGHSGLVYDALELRHDPDAAYNAERLGVTATPTIFYKQVGTSLAEIVRVEVEFATMQEHGNVELRLGSTRIHKELHLHGEFGEWYTDFEVPEWTGTANAEVRFAVPGSERRFAVQLTPAKKWTIFIVAHEHLDIGFTDYPEKVAELHSQSIDGVTGLMRTHPDFRWTLDGYWVAEKYLAGRSHEKQSEFLRLLREGRIVLPPQYANQHTGTASLEGLARSLYDSHLLALKNGFPLGAAHITDVPSYSWSYASILHAADVKHFAAASNAWRAPVLLLGKWNEKSPFYWEGPDGGRVLMWYSRAYLQLGTLFANPPRVAAVRDSLPVFLQAYSRPDYKASAAIVFGTQLENTALSLEQAEIVSQWQSQYAWPQLQYSTFADAMSTIESQFGDKIPVVRGDFGPYWEDGFGSDAFYTALHRQNQQRILSAEKMATIPALLDPGLRPDVEELRRAWEHTLLFDEHTWTYVGATTQPEHEQTIAQTELKRANVRDAADEITRSIHRSSGQFTSFLGPKENSLVIFNALGWSRSEEVEHDIQDGIGVFDTVTGKQIPLETVHVGKATPLPGFGGGYRRVRFLAEDVPGLGYKFYALRPIKADQESRPAADPKLFESPYYKLTINKARGTITSILDKQLHRELTNQSSPYPFGAYVYVSGADDMPHNSLYRYGAALKPPHLTATAAAHSRITTVSISPIASTVVLQSDAPNTPTVRTTIRLLNYAKRIEFSYEIVKARVFTKEAAYIAFPFAGEKPSFAYDTQNGWVNPAKDELLGGSREWYTVSHWAAVGGDQGIAAIIPRDEPLVSFGDIVRGNWPAAFQPQSATIFAWVMNNYWGTNFVPAQGGNFVFRYDLVSTATLDPAALTRTGWSTMTPLEVMEVPAAFSLGTLPPTQASLLKINNPDVALITWKLAEDGRGSIVRLEEIAGRKGTVRLASDHLAFTQAWRCSIVEDDQTPIAVSTGGVELPIRPFEIVTLRIMSKPRLSATGRSGEANAR